MEQNTNTEEWRAIANYEDIYQVSSVGRVRSVKTGRILKAVLSAGLYPVVGLSKLGVVKVFTVHRLVALSFIPNPENYTEVDHKNRCKTDNKVQNLRWVTRSTNLKNRTYKGSFEYDQILRPDGTSYGRYRVSWTERESGKRKTKCFRERYDAREYLDQVLERLNAIILN